MTKHEYRKALTDHREYVRAMASVRIIEPRRDPLHCRCGAETEGRCAECGNAWCSACEKFYNSATCDSCWSDDYRNL